MKRFPVVFLPVMFLVIVTAALAGCTQAPVQALITQTQAATPGATSFLPGTASGSSTYTGKGDDIRPFTLKDGGGLIIMGVYSGDANFMVRITDRDGKQVGSSLLNQTGSYTVMPGQPVRE